MPLDMRDVSDAPGTADAPTLAPYDPNKDPYWKYTADADTVDARRQAERNRLLLIMELANR